MERSSGYYHDLYKQNKNICKDCENDLKDLNKIYNNLTDDMGDKIHDVNVKMEDLKSDMLKAIRHNYTFTATANGVTTEKEKTVTADTYLGTTVSELQDEISRLNRKMNDAADQRDYYYSQYKAKKQEERQEFFDNIF